MQVQRLFFAMRERAMQAVFAEGEIRRDAVCEGETVAVFRGVEKRLADSAAGAGEQYVESFHSGVLVFSYGRRGRRF